MTDKPKKYDYLDTPETMAKDMAELEKLLDQFDEHFERAREKQLRARDKI